MAQCFSVEFELDRMLSEIFFPGTDTPGSHAFQDSRARELREVFDDLFLKGNRLNFASKIQVLKSLRKRLARLDGATEAELIGRLEKLRNLRNRFAHYPVSFFPEQIEGRQTLVAKLVCRDKDIALDQAFFDEADADFRFVQERLQEALAALRGETPSPAPA